MWNCSKPLLPHNSDSDKNIEFAQRQRSFFFPEKEHFGLKAKLWFKNTFFLLYTDHYVNLYSQYHSVEMSLFVLFSN